MMTQLKQTLVGIVALLAVYAIEAQSGNSDAKAEKIVKKMIKAHGGYDVWANAPSISYTHDMTDPRKPDDHWLSKEIHEQGRRRCYQEWTQDQAVLANDGNEIWTVGWKRLNPPSMMSGVSYFFINMVWMTQDDAANLEIREDKKVDAIEKGKSFKTVRLTFTGASEYEYFDMYIDRETYLLRGVNYTVTHKGLFKAFGLPEDTKFMGPLLKVYKEYTEVDGLQLTTRYDTYRPNGQAYGIHKVTDYDLKKEFDPSLLERPADATIASNE